MTIEELLSLEPDVSEYTSEQIVLELFHKDEWRCYPPNLCDETDELAERFLKYHAREPSLITEGMAAKRPVAVFYQNKNGVAGKGGLFINGAVIVAHYEGIRTVTLFIDEAHAQRLGYPEEGYKYLSQIESE